MTVDVTAASVKISVSIDVDDAGSAAVVSGLEASLSSPAAAEALFASVPGITIQVEEILANATVATPSNNNNDNGGGGGGGMGGVIVVLIQKL